MIRRAEVCFLLCFRGPDGEPKRYEHAGHYLGKPGSSGFLKVRRRLSGGGFSELASRCAGHWAGRGTYPAGRVRR